MKSKKNISVSLSNETIEKLKEKCKELNISLSSLIELV